ncbi:neugrin [Elysia marginata]|uniref:Neugrin n=1 Tax=Elysia marginata TaxID=1093978 RepID=A0AAV4H1F7_9GAST|nr:neugrin [Elysia marginata]
MQVVKELKPVKVVSLQKKTSNLTARVPRNDKRQVELEKFRNAQDEEFNVYEDQLASTVSKYSSKMAAHSAEAEFNKSLVKGLKTVRRYTLKQKYFKPPAFPNLLTWAAKEQIRFLHRSDPEDWTIDSLLEHFLVNEDTLRSILKYNGRVLEEKDILQHDKSVLQNWNRLHAQIESEDFTEVDHKHYLECFFNSQKECLVANATSLPHMPCSIRKKLKKTGPFSAIVQDCLQLQDKENEILTKEKIPSVTRQLSLKLEDTALLLQNMTSRQYKTDLNNAIFQLSELGVSKDKYSQFTKADRFSGSSVNTSSDIYIDKDKPSLSGTYIKSKSVYDENGEFLYKIP